MCWCNPNVRTPCCGGVNCHPKKEVVVNADTEGHVDHCSFSILTQDEIRSKAIILLSDLLKMIDDCTNSSELAEINKRVKELNKIVKGK